MMMNETQVIENADTTDKAAEPDYRSKDAFRDLAELESNIAYVVETYERAIGLRVTSIYIHGESYASRHGMRRVKVALEAPDQQ
jgi:hypothetical protein